MNLRQMTAEQLGLMLLGLRSIFVADIDHIRVAMIVKIEGELAAHGLKLAE